MNETLYKHLCFLLEPDDSKDVLFSACIENIRKAVQWNAKMHSVWKVFFYWLTVLKTYNLLGFFYYLFFTGIWKKSKRFGYLNCFVSPYWIIISHLVLLFHVLYHYCTWQYTVGIQTHQSTFLCSGWYCGLCSRQSFLCRDLQREIQQ